MGLVFQNWFCPPPLNDANTLVMFGLVAKDVVVSVSLALVDN